MERPPRWEKKIWNQDGDLFRWNLQTDIRLDSSPEEGNKDLVEHVDHAVLLLLGQDPRVRVLLILVDLLGIEPGLEYLVPQNPY